MKPLVTEFDAETQIETVREMTDEEYAQALIDKEEGDAKAAERLAKEQAEQAEKDAIRTVVEAKLAALGLDLDTVKAIAKL